MNEIRISAFITTFALFYILQRIFPYFKNKDHKRLYHNWYLFILSFLSLKIFFPLGIAQTIEIFNAKKITLINLGSAYSPISVIATIIIFDFFIYLQHVLSHKINFLWRFHKVHHSDREMGTTSGFRFHPIEIIMSGFYKVALIFIFRPSVEGYIIYEITLSSFALFNHSNIRINSKLDKLLKIFLVTPSFHFPHHDTEHKNMNSNYGNIFSTWDKLFRTYTTNKVSSFGIKEYNKPLTIRDVFYMPFR